MPEASFSRADWSGALWRIVRVIALRARLIAKVLFGNLRLTHALRGDWRERYERSRRDFFAADPVFHPSKQWEIITRFYRLVLRAWGLERFKSTFGRFLSTYEPDNPWIFEAVHHLYRQALAARDAWGLLDTLEEPELGAGTYVMYGGRRLSLDLLQSIDELYRVREASGFERDDRVVFCEVGAGYGRLADVVLSAMPNASYLIFDLPESLLLAQHYLTVRHPHVKAALYPESSEAVKDPLAPGAPRLIFGLPHQLREVKRGSVDAFVNVYSFMEMSRKQIETYFGIIDRLNPGTVYMKQHKREANIYDRSLNTGENYPVPQGWKKSYEGTSTLFEHVFEAAYRLKPIRASSFE
ncbi:MAG: putative sugar O-methyltransferase [Elusimicrobia bacterium]|nr:putative sugar O-methyltransferase [Elusimicrobiota bacterium]